MKVTRPSGVYWTTPSAIELSVTAKLGRAPLNLGQEPLPLDRLRPLSRHVSPYGHGPDDPPLGVSQRGRAEDPDELAVVGGAVDDLDVAHLLAPERRPLQRQVLGLEERPIRVVELVVLRVLLHGADSGRRTASRAGCRPG